jgi:hypothetical protein
LIELYPNPNTGQFAVRSQSIPAGKYGLTVFDVYGKLVYSEPVLNITAEFLHPLNLAFLTNGIYVLYLKNERTGYDKRFVISK